MKRKKSSGQEQETQASDSIMDWLTVEQFCSRFPNIPEKTVKWQLTARHKNGLARHVQVIGKQRYISMSGYAKWLNANVAVSSSIQGRA